MRTERNDAFDVAIANIIKLDSLLTILGKIKDKKNLTREEFAKAVNFLLEKFKQNTPTYFILDALRDEIDEKNEYQAEKLNKQLQDVIQESLLAHQFEILSQMAGSLFKRSKEFLYYAAVQEAPFGSISDNFYNLGLPILKKYKENLESLREVIRSAEIPEEKTLHLRRLISNFQVWRKTANELLHLSQLFFELKNLDLTSCDLSELDLHHLVFEESNFSHANLTNVQCSPIQFVKVYGIDKAIMDEKLRELIYETRNSRLEDVMKVVPLVVEEYQTRLQMLNQFMHLTCQGERPDLSKIDDAVIHGIATLIMQSYYINDFPSDHPFCYKKMERGFNFETKINSMSPAEVRELLYEFLNHRKFYFSAHGLAYVKMQKTSLIYESIDNSYDQLKRLTRYISEISDSHPKKAALLKKAQELLAVLTQVRSQKKESLRQSLQEYVDVTLQNLNDAPDEHAEWNPYKRLESVFDTSRSNADIRVDLTAYDISKWPFEKIDIRDVNLIISRDQEHQLPWEQQNQRYEPLLQAIMDENIPEISRLLKLDLNINHQFRETGRTPFMTACYKNKPKAVEFLLQNGADPSIKTESGWLIIESTAREHHANIIKILCDAGQILDFFSAVHLNDPDAVKALVTPVLLKQLDRDGQSALHIATKNGYHLVMELLLMNGMDVNALNNAKKTALHIAIQINDKVAIEKLLGMGARVDSTHLRLACEHNLRDLADALRKKCDDIDLYSAMYFEDFSMVKKLIGQNYNEPQADGFTPLVSAVKLGKPNYIRWLLAHSADINGVCKNSTPLLSAIDCDQTEAATILLENCQLILNENVKGTTPPLFHAVQNDKAAWVSWLLSKKALGKALVNVNTKYLDRTALHLAAHMGLLPIVRLLLEAGADGQSRDLANNTALDLAVAAGHTDVVKCFVMHSLQKAKSTKNSELAKFISELTLLCDGPINSQQNASINSVRSVQTTTSLFVPAKQIQKSTELSGPMLHGVMPDGATCNFREAIVAGDGNCGFTTLGISRRDLMDALLPLQNEAAIRECLVNEILNSLRGNEIKPYDSKIWRELIARAEEAESSYNRIAAKIARAVPECLERQNPISHEFLNYLEGQGYVQFVEILKRQHAEVLEADAALREFAGHPKMYQHYIEMYAGNLWLGRDTALLYARTCGLTIYIWEKAEVVDQLKLIAHHEAGAARSNVIHMLFTQGYTHFNLLFEQPALENQVVQNDEPVQKLAEVTL